MALMRLMVVGIGWDGQVRAVYNGFGVVLIICPVKRRVDMAGVWRIGRLIPVY
jgi:hypothetical protein